MKRQRDRFEKFKIHEYKKLNYCKCRFKRIKIGHAGKVWCKNCNELMADE